MGTRPSWPTIAAELTAEGLSTSDGKPITAEYARQAWWRAQKAYQAKRPPREPPPVAPKTRRGETAPGVSRVPPAPPAPLPLPVMPPADHEPAESPRPKVKIDFKPATFRNPSDKDS